MKTILITGAGSGIGRATAERFLAEGWYVIGTYHNTPLSFVHDNLFSVSYDQADTTSIAHAVEEITAHGKRFDALVNCAAVLLDYDSEKPDREKIARTFTVDTLGVVDMTERLLPLCTGEAHIVNVDSIYGAFSLPIDDGTSLGYRMAKAALNMYTRTLAFRLKDTGMIVSSVHPGWVKTDMGNLVSDETSHPDKEPSAAADDIYRLVTEVKESGYFWDSGKKREW